MNDEEQAIMIKYFDIINTSIKDNKAGLEWAKVHISPTPDQIAQVKGEITANIQIKNMFVKMAEELKLKLV